MSQENNNNDSDMAIGPSFDSISLSSFGVFPIFTEINENISERCIEFILKANIMLKPDFPLTFFINCPGGNVTDGWAITTMMETSGNPISTVAIGQVASMGLMIFVAGDKGLRIMTPNTMVLAHQWSAGTYGKQHELVAARKMHDQVEEQFIEHLVKHTKMSEKLIKQKLLGPSDSYLTPEECLKYGICDRISNPFNRTENEVVEILSRRKSRQSNKTKVVS